MDVKFFKSYHRLENNHWWFLARKNILIGILEKHIGLSTDSNLKILNAGVATGATSLLLEPYGDVTSVEYDKDCCDFLEEYVGIKALNESLTDLSLEDESFDMVCAFDVVEHIKEDRLAIKEIARVLKPGGFFFLTVPAFQALWGDHDVINHHQKRYKKNEFNQLILNENLAIKYTSYFNFWLFIPIAFARISKRILKPLMPSKNVKSDNEVLDSVSFFTKTCQSIFQSERSLLIRKIRFPFGVSIMTWGVKK